jgi:hypothetical protein
MRSIQFSGFKTQPWGNTQLLYNDEFFPASRINEATQKVKAPTNAPAKTLIDLHFSDGIDVATIHVNNKIEGGVSAPIYQKEPGHIDLFRKIAEYFQNRSSKN